MIEKIKYTTHHPSERYAAEQSFPRQQERIRQSSEPAGERDRFRIRWWKYAAAAASVAILFTLGYYAFRQQPGVEIQTRVLAATNERMQFVLPDGSLIWLNAESKLTCTDAFGDKTREVQLAGEAYFEVAKDAERPFVVIMDGVRVQVLGTIFNIRAYPDDHEIVTTLAEGSVSFTNTQSDTTATILKPGQQLFFDKDNEHIVIREVDCSPYISWKDGRLIFRQTPLNDVFAVMEQTFRIKIVTNNTSLYNRKITATFGSDEKPEDILKVMRQMLKFNFEVKADTIYIK